MPSEKTSELKQKLLNLPNDFSLSVPYITFEKGLTDEEKPGNVEAFLTDNQESFKGYGSVIYSMENSVVIYPMIAATPEKILEKGYSHAYILIIDPAGEEVVRIIEFNLENPDDYIPTGELLTKDYIIDFPTDFERVESFDVMGYDYKPLEDKLNLLEEYGLITIEY